MAPLAQERATRKCQRQGPGVQLRAFEDTQIKIRDQTPPDRPTPNLLLRQYRDADLAAVLSAREDASRLVHPFIADQYFAPERETIPRARLHKAGTRVAGSNNEVAGLVALIGNEVSAIFGEPGQHGTGAGRAPMDEAGELHEDPDVEEFSTNSVGRRFIS